MFLHPGGGGEAGNTVPCPPRGIHQLGSLRTRTSLRRAAALAPEKSGVPGRWEPRVLCSGPSWPLPLLLHQSPHQGGNDRPGCPAWPDWLSQCTPSWAPCGRIGGEGTQLGISNWRRRLKTSVQGRGVPENEKVWVRERGSNGGRLLCPLARF